MGVLSALRRDASSAHRNRPFVTDLTTEGRTEFTGALFEQWVTKTSNYLEAEFGRELQLHIALRAHWLWPVLIAALDELEGTLVPRELADIQLRMDPDASSEVPVLLVHDHPMALPFREPLPAMHHDFFLEVRGGGDVRSAGPAHNTPLVDDGSRTWTAADLQAAAPTIAANARISVIANSGPLVSAADIATLSVTPWAADASIVIAHDSSALTGERCTVELRIGS